MAQRREAREAALKALYAEEVSKTDVEQILANIVKPAFQKGDGALKFAESLFLRVLKNQEEVDEVIRGHIENWKMERLAIIDKVILRMAICEFLFFEEIPTKVTMNEAIELAKRFSTNKSGRFVNGILDSALGALREEGRIEKSGRGLIETNTNS
ncbi:MAG: transcription antitermination factor NusB [Balneolaceae bacterium]|nr:transcription antitermination factor NusB [Balneolaceae bacterium]